MLILMTILCVQSPPTVTSMDPSPGTIHISATSVTLTLSPAPAPASITATTVTLVGAGPDGLLGTGDDATVTPTSISVNGGVITLDLSGQPLGDDLYQVRLSGSPAVPPAAGARFAHWTMNEGSGSTVADSSGNGRHGTMNGAAFASGLFGNAVAFNGGVTRVDVDAGTLAPNWTACLWVHRSGNVAGTAATLMDCSAASTGTSLRLEQFVGDQIGITEYTIVDYGFGVTAPLNAWVHLAFTSDSANARLYVNGALQNTAPRGFNLTVDKLGSATTFRTNSLIGLLDEVQIYSRLLTVGEITSLATLTGGIRSAGGEILDGEFADAFPSGNGAGGGDFAATFRISSTYADLTVGGCGLVGPELLVPAGLLLLWRRRTAARRVLLLATFLAGTASAVNAQEPAPPAANADLGGPFATVRAGAWLMPEFEASTIRGLRRIRSGAMADGGIDFGLRLDPWAVWASFDYAQADDVSVWAGGVHVGMRVPISLDERLPLRGGVSLGALGGQMEADADGFGDFDPGWGFQARGELAAQLEAGLGVSLWIDFRFLPFDFEEPILSGDDEALGSSLALGVGLSLRF